MSRSRKSAAPIAAAALAAFALPLAGCGGGSSTDSSPQSSATHGRPASTAPAAPTSTTAPTSTAAPTSTTATSSGAVTTVLAVASGVRASLRASTHAPKVERPWPIHFTVTRAGRPARATLEYEYLFGGQVVAHRSHYTFTGRFSDLFKWPSSAVGYPLTFRAVIVSDGVTFNLDYPVQVAK
jgi:hypothetical protein